MLDVHVPHKSEHTWTDFIIHIATITVGLFIAIGIEQTVEFFHHLHQRHQLEESLRDELRDAEDFRVFNQIRAYTVELKSAVSARRTSAASPPAPPAAKDSRRSQIPTAPSIRVVRGLLDGATDRNDLNRRAFPDHRPPSLDKPPAAARSIQP